MQELVALFGPRLALPENSAVLLECNDICSKFALSPDDLFEKWELHAVSLALMPQSRNAESESAHSDELSIPTLPLLHQLRLQIKREVERISSSHFAPIPTSSSLLPSDSKRSTAKVSVFARKSVNVKREGSVFTKDTLGALLPMAQSQSATQPTPSPRHLSTPNNQTRKLAQNPPSTSSFSRTTSFMNSASSPTPTPAASSKPGPLTAFLAQTPSGSASTNYASRSNRGSVVESFNDKIPFPTSTNAVPGHVEVGLLENQQTKSLRYMHSKVADKSDILDARVELLSEEVQKLHKWDSIAHPAQPSQEPIRTAGRISIDTVTDPAAKLNEQSIVLESCRAHGSGARVLLELSKLVSQGAGYAFFPGQIIGVEGISTGEKIIVDKLVELPCPIKPQDTLMELMDIYESSSRLTELHNQENDMASTGTPRIPPATFMVAAGPFTLEDNLLFEPFNDLVQEIKLQNPSVVILLGPFIDINHPHLVSGQITMTPSDIFEQHIMDPLCTLPRHTKIILIPHVRDATSEFVSFPQPPLQLQSPPPNILSFPNPCQLTLNDAVVAVSSTDILFHLGAEEIARVPPNTKPDRMARLASHVLSQRHFYPLFPASQVAPTGIQYAPSQLYDTLTFQIQPDILILPSQLRHFVKNVMDTLVISPGPVAKKVSGGTYAKAVLHPLEFPEKIWNQYFARKRGDAPIVIDGVTIKPEPGTESTAQISGTLSNSKNELDTLLSHVVCGRARVDILRI